MVTYYLVTVIISAIIIIIGTAIASICEDKDDRTWGIAILALGIAGVIWGGLNSHIVAQEESIPYDRPIQTVTVGRVLSFEDNTLIIAQDLVKGETATFILPAHIAQAISTRGAIILDDQQIAAVTTIGDEVTEVAIALSGTPPIGIRQVVDAETRGGTGFWWFAVFAAGIILILGFVLDERTHADNSIVYTGVAIGVIAIIYLFFSALACGALGAAKRGEINEDYIPAYTIGVVEGIDGRDLDITTMSGVENTSCRLGDTYDSLKLSDKVSIVNPNTSSESLLLIFN